jgi:hypothetical protein
MPWPTSAVTVPVKSHSSSLSVNPSPMLTGRPRDAASEMLRNEA